MVLINKVFTLAGKATSVMIGSVMASVIEKINSVDFSSTLDQLDQAFTPIEVNVTCRHDSDEPNDYRLEIDLTVFERALNEGRKARPKIIVRSTFTNLNRDLLAERLEIELRPLIKNYEKHIKQRKVAILTQRESDAFWGEIAIFVLLMAGAVLGPFIWIIIGLEGWRALASVPQLLISAIKSSLYKYFFGDEIEQLDAELEAARKTIRAMVKRAQIEPLSDK